MEGRGVGFSHARLSIIDLDEDRARQPFRSADGQLLLAQNGELYDYKRLRADLVSRGARFRTKSDSELVMHLYPRLGLEDMLPHLRGEFAFALYDRKSDRLYAGARSLRHQAAVLDRDQRRPCIRFRTEGVVCASGRAAQFHLRRGFITSSMQTIVPGTTAFDGIHQVKPGSCSRSSSARDGRCTFERTEILGYGFPAGGRARGRVR